MNPHFEIKQNKETLRITDTTQQYDEYSEETDLINCKFKYEDTITVNILEYHFINDEGNEESEVVSTSYTDHSLYLDEEYITIDKDGYYLVHHLILPTVDWLQQIGDTETQLFVTDGEKMYQVVNNQLVEQDSRVMIEINTENTTISRSVCPYFSVAFLYDCYMNYVKSIFNADINKCKSDSENSDVFGRDFLWMTINAIKYNVSSDLYLAAQQILQSINYCNAFCGQASAKMIVKTGSCGCSR